MELKLPVKSQADTDGSRELYKQRQGPTGQDYLQVTPHKVQALVSEKRDGG